MIGAIIGGAAALGSALIGGIASANANKRANKLLNELKKENRQWYEIERSSDYTRRSDVQAALTRQRELLDEYAARARATNAVAGGSEASIASQQQAAANSIAQTAGNIASAAAERRDEVERQYRNTNAQLTMQQIGQYRQQAGQAAQAGAQGVNAGLSSIAALTNNTAGPEQTPQPTAIQSGPILSAPINTDLSPSSIPGPTTGILSPDELPRIRKSNT